MELLCHERSVQCKTVEGVEVTIILLTFASQVPGGVASPPNILAIF